MEESLENLRKKINLIDYQLLRLLKKRGDIVNKIGILKKEQGIELHHPKREKEIIKKLIKNNLVDNELITELWTIIMNHSKKNQQKLLDDMSISLNGVH
tara:strand:- start:161 stop:457 length:297 start_codon:yes stop_codon:yes gene_type:complete